MSWNEFLRSPKRGAERAPTPSRVPDEELRPRSVQTRVVTRTYLEMRSFAELRPSNLADVRCRFERLVNCPPSFYRFLYREVGKNYHWRDRLSWSDDQIKVHVVRQDIAVWVMYRQGTPAGWFELQQHRDRSTEVVYFGLLPEYMGKGLGKHMLSAAVEEAWATGAERVWLHTCSLDSPRALPNYLKRGFRPYKEERYNVALPTDD